MLTDNAIPYEVSDGMSPAEFKLAYDYATLLREKRAEEEKRIREASKRRKK